MNNEEALIDPEAVYSRQYAIDNLVVPQEATVIGVGGTGSWVALMLALLGCPDLTLVDADRVEVHNLNRLPLPLSAIGQYKVHALANEIVRYRPNILVTPVPRQWEGGNELFRGTVFDCVDNNRVQAQIYQTCQESGIYYCRSGCGQDAITAVARIPGWGTDDGDGYGAQGVPIWVGPAVLSAVRAVGLMAQNWPEVSGPIAHIDTQ